MASVRMRSVRGKRRRMGCLSCVARDRSYFLGVNYAACYRQELG